MVKEREREERRKSKDSSDWPGKAGSQLCLSFFSAFFSISPAFLSFPPSFFLQSIGSIVSRYVCLVFLQSQLSAQEVLSCLLSVSLFSFLFLFFFFFFFFLFFSLVA